MANRTDVIQSNNTIDTVTGNNKTSDPTKIRDSQYRIQRDDDEAGFVTPLGSFCIKREGDINFVNKYAKISIGSWGGITEEALSADISIPRYALNTFDFVLNHRKFNNKFCELADFQKINKSKVDTNEVNIKSGVAGHLCVFGTLMTKSWSARTNEYVLVRRLTYMPMFSPSVKD